MAAASIVSVWPRGEGARRGGVLPGFGMTLGFTVVYLGVIVIIPLTTLFSASASFSAAALQTAILSPRVFAAFRLSIGASLLAATLNAVFGFLVAWVLVRYRFFGRQLIDALVDLPFALPTAVGGIALTAIYAQKGIVGRHLAAAGVKVAFTPLGVVVALTFIGLPFVVRMVQPVLQDLEPAIEEVAASLGATRWQIFTRVLLPQVAPACLSGGVLAFARALGEYGSVVFISGNMPFKTETVPFLVLARLEQFDYAGATAVAVLMLLLSVTLLLTVNLLQGRRAHAPAAR